MRFSASRIKSHMGCSLQAKYRYVDKLPTRQNAKASFGTVIHAALELYYNSRGDIDQAIAFFKTNWAHPERLGVEPDYWPKFTSFGSLMGKGIEALQQVHERHVWNNVTVIGTEIPFLVPFGRHELTGYIDLLSMEKSGTGHEEMILTDHKTNSRNPSTATLALDPQFTVYCYATHQREFWVGGLDPEFPGIPNGDWLWSTIGELADRRCRWHGVLTARMIDAGPRTTVDFQRLYRVCDEIERAQQLGVAVPTIGESCLYCDYQSECSLEIPIAITQLQDKEDPTRWI